MQIHVTDQILLEFQLLFLYRAFFSIICFEKMNQFYIHTVYSELFFTKLFEKVHLKWRCNA